MKPLHFSFLTVFSPACGINIPLRGGKENGFCIEMRQPPFFEEKKSLQIEKQENSDGAKAAPESRRIASRFWRFLRT